MKRIQYGYLQKSVNEVCISYGRDVDNMFVIGINEWELLKIKSRTMMLSCKIWNEVEKVIYECVLSDATIFSNYEIAVKIAEEIKMRKNEIIFENDNIIGQILDKEKGKEFDVDAIKIYELIPTECKKIY